MTRPPGHVVVVIGTGTGVGKTHVTLALVRALEARGAVVAAWKPVVTGTASPDGDDARALAAALGRPLEPPVFSAPEPISAHLAAARLGRSVDIDAIAGRARALARSHDYVVVETAGGLFSPLGPWRTNADVVRALAPGAAVLVAPDRLGVLHDVGAALRAARAESLAVHALALSAPEIADASTGTNAGELVSLGIAPEVVVFARAPFDAAASLAAAGALLDRLGPAAPLLGGRGLGCDRDRRLARDDLAAVDAHRARAQALGEARLVGDDDDDGARLGLFAHDAQEERDALAIEAGGRLVEQEQRGVVQDGAGEGDALALAPRHGAHGALGEGPDAEPRRGGLDGVGPEAVKLGGPVQVLEAREVGVDERVVPEPADVRPHALGVGPERRPLDPPRARAQRAAQQREQRALARAVRALDERDRARLEALADVAQGDGRAVHAADVVHDGRLEGARDHRQLRAAAGDAGRFGFASVASGSSALATSPIGFER
jgi:dethiobiotin synthetase